MSWANFGSLGKGKPAKKEKTVDRDVSSMDQRVSVSELRDSLKNQGNRECIVLKGSK